MHQRAHACLLHRERALCSRMAFEALQKRCLISYTAPWPLCSWVQSDGRRWPLRMSFTFETAAFPACASTTGAIPPSCINGTDWQGRVWSGEASTYDGLGTVEAALTAICRVNPHCCRGPLFERNWLVSGLRHHHRYHTAMSRRRGLMARQRMARVSDKVRWHRS